MSSLLRVLSPPPISRRRPPIALPPRRTRLHDIRHARQNAAQVVRKVQGERGAPAGARGSGVVDGGAVARVRVRELVQRSGELGEGGGGGGAVRDAREELQQGGVELVRGEWGGAVGGIVAGVWVGGGGAGPDGSGAAGGARGGEVGEGVGGGGGEGGGGAGDGGVGGDGGEEGFPVVGVRHGRGGAVAVAETVETRAGRGSVHVVCGIEDGAEGGGGAGIGVGVGVGVGLGGLVMDATVAHASERREMIERIGNGL